MNAPHLHLALNHLPVVGILFTLCVLAAGLILRKEVVSRVALWMAIVCAIVVVPAYLTGKPAEEATEHLPGVSEVLIEPHEEAAAAALGSVMACGLIASAALFNGRAGRQIRRALLGGKIRHTEIR